MFMKINKNNTWNTFFNEMNSLCLRYFKLSFPALGSACDPFHYSLLFIIFLKRQLYEMPLGLKGQCCEKKDKHFSMLVGTKIR